MTKPKFIEDDAPTTKVTTNLVQYDEMSSALSTAAQYGDLQTCWSLV